jgi:hypothetical protein
VNDPLGVGRGENVEQPVHRRDHVVEGELASEAHGPGLERLSLEELHDQKYGAVVHDVVVENAHDAWVADGVGDVALAEKSSTNIRVSCEVAVKDFHGDAVTVAMRGRIHGGRRAVA